ncbi:MAG TPA: patatin-like phospholipase family protein [Burkholderiaceae bacterium]|nr:patatin-like phospholipase family protein [Burkholderiaceae bacterium]
MPQHLSVNPARHSAANPVPAVLRVLAALLALSCAATPLRAQDASAPSAPAVAAPAAVAPGGRLSVGLVLSGGGARGFAHVGVLKVLEELGIEVSVVTATSMGSIVGGGYALGYTADEMEKIIRAVNWGEIFSSRAPRADLIWRRKEDDYKNLASNEIGLTGGKPALPQGALSAQNLELFLRTLAEPAGTTTDLELLPIPFAAMATNLVTGKLVVMQRGATLEQAMRASMSVPGVFPPMKFYNQLLVDGGLVQNLPVEYARTMGADVVIAVNVGTPLSGRDDLGSLLGVANQMINILTEQNVQTSLGSLTPRDVLIVPDLEQYGSGDFDKFNEIIAAGEAAARALVPRLQALASSKQRYAQWEQKRIALIKEPEPVLITEVRVDGLKTVNPESVKADVQLPLGRPVSQEDVNQTATLIWGSSDFEAVSYRLQRRPDGTQTLVVLPLEKPWGYNTLRLGGSLQTDFKDSNTFSLVLAHTWSWLNSWGGEWRNEFEIGQTGRLLTEFYQPLGARSNWFVLPKVELLREDFDVYLGDQAVARLDNTLVISEVGLGYSIGRLGYLKAAGGYASTRTDIAIGTPFIPAQSSSSTYASVTAKIDTLDNVGFPRHGTFLEGEYTVFQKSLGTAAQSSSYLASLLQPFSWGPNTVHLAGRFGRATQDGSFRLGGIFNLSGTPFGEVAGSQVTFARAMYYRNIRESYGDFRMPVFLGFSLEAGKASNTNASFSDYSWRKAGSVFVGADTLLGSVYLAVGHTIDGSSAVYLYWGRPR